MKYSITYQVVTPESAEIGDFEDTGFLVENDEDDLRYIICKAKGLGIVSRSQNDLTHWWESEDPGINYQTGEQTYYNLHINCTPSSFKRINNLLKETNHVYQNYK